VPNVREIKVGSERGSVLGWFTCARENNGRMSRLPKLLHSYPGLTGRGEAQVSVGGLLQFDEGQVFGLN